MKEFERGSSLVVWWLRLHAPSVGGPSSILGQETRHHMPQLRAQMPQLKFCTLQLRPGTDFGEVAQTGNNLPAMPEA